LVITASGLTRGGRSAVAGGNKFQGLRFGCAHAPGGDAQALRAFLHFDHGANQVALFAPQLQKAAPVLPGHGVTRCAHVKEDTPILKQRGCRMIDQVLFDALDQPFR